MKQEWSRDRFFPAYFCSKLCGSIRQIKLYTCESDGFQHEFEAHSQNAKHRCPMSASCQSMSLSTEPGGSLGGGSNLGIYKEPSLSQEPQVQAVKVSSVSPEFWPCCVLPQSHVLLTLGCSALSLLTLCCPIGNDECILGGD